MLLVFSGLRGEPAHAAEADTAALLELSLNGVNKGTARVILRGDQIFVAVATLKQAGLRDVPGARVDIAGQLFVALASLTPEIEAVYDEDNLALVLNADPRLLAPTTIDLAASAPPNLEYIDSPSGFINYAVTAEDGHTPGFISEQGARFGAALLTNNFSVSPRGRFVRGNTALAFDNRGNFSRLIVGDAIVSGGTLGGVGRIGGVSYVTDFALNPYVTPFPNQRFAGVVSTPSTADIYVNGRLVRTIDVPPGVFNLENLPGVSGAGRIRVVLRNAFGQSQELSAPYYMGTQLLRRGLHDFGYSLGFVRDPGLSGIGGYEHPAGIARHRYGFTDTLTAGGYFAAEDDKLSGGPEFAFSFAYGTVGLFAAASRHEGRNGQSAAVQYTYQSPTFSAGASYTYTSAQYATFGLERRDDRATSRADAFIGIPVGSRSDLSLDIGYARFRDLGESRRVALTGSTRLTERLSVALTVSHTRFPNLPENNGVFAALTMPVGTRTTASASLNADRERTNAAVQLQQSLPYGEGLGYFVQAAVGKDAPNFANLQYQGRTGLYTVDVLHVGGETRVSASAAGALVFIGGRVFAARPVEDAFALIRVPGVAGVSGTLSHQHIGVTDARGDLLVPNLLGNYGNELGINDQDIPLDYSIGSTGRAVAPRTRGGAVVEFPVRKLQAYVGTLEVMRGGETIVPAYGDLEVAAGGTTVASPIGAAGDFYLEMLPGETNDARVRYEGGSCRFTIAAMASAERFVELGKLICVEK
ncbi:MAG: fimbria/pilus outer membrane usher protein [Rhodospirillaceae bacterium]